MFWNFICVITLIYVAYVAYTPHVDLRTFVVIQVIILKFLREIQLNFVKVRHQRVARAMVMRNIYELSATRGRA